MGIYDREYVREERPGLTLGGDRMMVTNLILVNCAIFVVDLLVDGSLSRWMKLPANVFSHPLELWKLLTCGFAHDPHDWRHIFGNMLALWFFGRDVEGVYGRREFLRIYLSLIVLCSLFWVAWENVPALAGDPHAFVLGASGAVTGIVILFALHYPRRTVLLFFVLPIPAWVLGIIFVASDLSGGADARTERTAVAYQIHLAGAALALGYYWSGIRLGQFIPSGWSLSRFKFRPKLRVHDPDRPERGSPSRVDLSSEVDRILEKISQHGQDSLTEKERQTLEDASRRYQRRRG
jgi:membrane associated rhomboid family serine protease